MKILTPLLHGFLDYATCAVFAAAPNLIGFTPFTARLSYVLAGIHLAMTLITRFPLGVVKILPFKIHSLVELLVSVLLIIASQLSPAFDGPARIFFTVMAAAIFVVWLFTRIDEKE